MSSVSLSFRRKPQRSRLWLWLSGIMVLCAGTLLGAPYWVALQVVSPPRVALGTTPSSAGLAFREVEIPAAASGQELKGWFIAGSGGRATVILLHGYGTNRLQQGTAVPAAKALAAAGYGVLLYDQRGHGESGAAATFGPREAEDLQRVAERVRSTWAPGSKVVAWGRGLGANVALHAARQADLAALILEDPSLDVTGDTTRLIGRESPFPDLFFSGYVGWLTRVFHDAAPERMQPLKEVALLSPRPLLVVQSSEQTPSAELLLHLSAQQGNELLVARRAAPDDLQAATAVTERVVHFLSRAMPN